jgi:sec-independent protein translocase protein TatA
LTNGVRRLRIGARNGLRKAPGPNGGDPERKAQMGGIGFKEILVILLILVILFGANRIPELARGMGRGVREFKDAMKDGEKHDPPTDKKP